VLKKTGRTRGGFSLVELMIVLALIGIALAITAPTVFRTLERMEIRSSVKEISAALRYSRSLAVSHKTRTRFYIDIDTQLYWVTTPGEERALRELKKKYEDDQEEQTTEGVILKKRPGIKKKSVNPLIRIDIFSRAGEDWDAGIVRITFSPFGNSTGGLIHVVPAVEAPHAPSFEINVDPVTGRVRKKEIRAEG